MVLYFNLVGKCIFVAALLLKFNILKRKLKNISNPRQRGDEKLYSKNFTRGSDDSAVKDGELVSGKLTA